MNSIKKNLFIICLISLIEFDLVFCMVSIDTLIQTIENNEPSLELAQNAIAQANLKVQIPHHRYDGLKLFSALFKKGYGFDEAIEVAEKKILSKDDQPFGFMLFNELFKFNKGVDAAVKIANDKISKATNNKSDDQIDVKFGLEIFENLIESYQGFDQAINAVKKTAKIISKSDIVAYQAGTLYRKIITNLRKLLLTANAQQQIELWCKKAIDKDLSNQYISFYLQKFEEDLPVLILQNKLIILKASLDNLKLKLETLKGKLKILQQKL